MQHKSKAEIEDDRQIRLLAKALKSKGLEIRREKLARGDAFRVKSGSCKFSGQDIIFIDSRLPYNNQLSVLIDYIVDSEIDLDSGDMKELSSSTQSLLRSRNLSAA